MLKTIKNVIDKKINSSIYAQLTFSFLGMFILIVAASSLLIYRYIGNTLEKNYESNSIQQFRQYDYNINTFKNEVDLISRQLVFDAYLQEIISYGSLQENERVNLAAETFRAFSQVLRNYEYIDSIVYYSSDGLILRASASKNEIIFDNKAKKDRFSHMEMNHITDTSKLKLVWLGGYNNRDFNIDLENNPGKETKPVFYLTAARTVYSGSQRGILVVNVNIHYFTSIYNYSDIGQNYRRYIINKSGTILSNLDESLIGTKSRVFEKIDDKELSETFTFDDGSKKLQVVYYRLCIPGWLLVNEVPVKTIQKDITVLRNIILLIFLAGMVIATILSRYWIYMIINPLKKLTGLMKKMEYGSLNQALEVSAKNEIGTLIDQFNKMSAGIRDLIRKNALIQDEKSRIEMKALRSQINPHFIYNTLNTIKWMAIIKKADNIAECIATLSEFLQPIFKNKDNMCSLKEEVDYITNYAKIMNFRYAGGFKTQFCIPEGLLQCRVLCFMLQPLVENAITHGLMNQNGGEITIRAWIEENSLMISVKDNGVGIDENKLREINEYLANGTILQENGNECIGLTNVNRRIRLHFGEEYGLKINSLLGMGTEVVVKSELVLES